MALPMIHVPDGTQVATSYTIQWRRGTSSTRGTITVTGSNDRLLTPAFSPGTEYYYKSEGAQFRR